MLKVDIDMDMLAIYALIILAITLLLYVILDVNYFIRVAFTIGYAKLFEKKYKVDETGVIYGFSTTQDLDLMLNHMNNARYIREADFGRFHFFERTGLYKTIVNAEAHILQGAISIRYRRSIPLFKAYKVTTKVMYWDEKNLYFEQQFITLDDGFVRTVILSQQKLINLKINEVLAQYLNKDESYRPEVPEELKLWMSSIDASSTRLRKKDE